MWGTEPSESIGAGAGCAGRIAPGLFVEPRPSVGIGRENPAVFIIAGNPGTASAAGVGGNFIQAEYADENHTDNWSGKKKCLPTGLKGNPLHLCLPALEPRT